MNWKKITDANKAWHFLDNQAKFLVAVKVISLSRWNLGSVETLKPLNTNLTSLKKNCP